MWHGRVDGSRDAGTDGVGCGMVGAMGQEMAVRLEVDQAR